MRAAYANAVVFRTVSRDSRFPANLPREFARYRSMSECASEQALSYGSDTAGGSIDPDRRQRASRLAHLRRVRPTIDCQSTRVSRGGPLWSRTSHTHTVYARCHDDRFVFVGVPLGQISHYQSGSEAAYDARSARLYSQGYSHIRRKTSRS